MFTKHPYHIIVQCSICRKVLGLKGTDRQEQDATVSHSYCEPCGTIACSGDDDAIQAIKAAQAIITQVVGA